MMFNLAGVETFQTWVPINAAITILVAIIMSFGLMKIATDARYIASVMDKIIAWQNEVASEFATRKHEHISISEDLSALRKELNTVRMLADKARNEGHA